MKKFILYLISCVSSLSADYGEFNFGYAFGNFITVDENYLELGCTTPYLISENLLTFADLTGYRFDDGKWAASFGAGIRSLISQSTAVGFNLYYDFRNGHSHCNYNQLGVGFEWLSCCFDLRANGYFQVSKASHPEGMCIFNNIGDGFFATREKIEFAYNGFDAEIGAPIWQKCNFNLYGAIGPFYYFKSHFENFAGGYMRFEIDWRSVLSFEVLASYDRLHNARVQGIIEISIPLNYFCQRQCACEPLFQNVYRNNIIQTDHCCHWTWNWD